MAVVFIQPVTGGPFGPGFIVALDSNFVGPLETGSFWRLYVTETGGEAPLVSEDVPTTVNNTIWWFRTGSVLSGTPFPFASQQLNHGKTVSLKAELRSPTSILDSGSIPITWDIVSGVPYLQNLINAQRVGLTAPQAAQLEEIDRVVHMDLGGLGRIGLSELLGLPTAGLTSRLLITPDRTLEGTLSRPLVGLDVAALGLEWEVVSAPPGVGVVQGAPDRWARRILDIQQVGTDGFANEYTRAFDSFHVDHYRLMFNPVGLTRLHYWIEPGITLRFYWLLLGI